MKTRAVCLSVSKRNKRYIELINDYALEFGESKSATIFRIIGEYNTYRIMDLARR